MKNQTKEKGNKKKKRKYNYCFWGWSQTKVKIAKEFNKFTTTIDHKLTNNINTRTIQNDILLNGTACAPNSIFHGSKHWWINKIIANLKHR